MLTRIRRTGSENVEKGQECNVGVSVCRASVLEWIMIMRIAMQWFRIEQFLTSKVL